jgi:hypothetical protein
MQKMSILIGRILREEVSEMSHVLMFSRKNPRALRLLTAIVAAAIVLAAGSALRGNIADLFAGKPSESGAYPGAVNYKNATHGMFGCELKEVSYHFYRTTKSAAKAAAFYQKRGFTVIRDDSVSTCCISKTSYVLSGRQNGSTVYVTVESPWFDEKRYMGDTLIVAASAR